MTKEEKRESNRKYYQANKNRLKERAMQHYLEHADERREYAKQYRLEHTDECRERCREYCKQYRQTKEGRANNLAHNYNQKDKAKGFNISSNVTAEWITANIFSGQSCVYCGETDWQKLGVDRIDNSKPHTPDNVVCSCWDCNKERNRRYTLEEFKQIKMGEVVATSPETSPL